MNAVTRCQPLLGTYVDITISGDVEETDLHAYCNDAFEVIYKVQELMSFHDPESELNKINSLKPDTKLVIHPWVFEVLKTALKLSEQTDGLYDITIGSTMVKKELLPNIKEITHGEQGDWKDVHLNQANSSIKLGRPVTIDLGGIAKGFAIDQAMDVLKKHNLNQAIINAGGDIKMLRSKDETIHIRVASDSKFSDHDLIERPMQDNAVATSSSTFAPNHEPSYIIDPRENECISDNRSISIFTSDCIIADALTKAAFLLPKETLDSLLDYYKASAVIIP